MASTPHLAIPFTILPDGTAATVEQGSLDDLTQCVEVLVATPVGSRVEVPSYGIPDPTFAINQVAAIEAAAATWEPRATVTAAATMNPQNPQETDITVTVQAVGS